MSATIIRAAAGQLRHPALDGHQPVDALGSVSCQQDVVAQAQHADQRTNVLERGDHASARRAT